MKNSTKSNLSKLRVASFFSGAGGLDLGFHELGYEIVFATDIEKVFCQTLEANKGRYLNDQAKVVCGDIREIQPCDLPENIDLVIGGPPCQSFSASGRRAGGAAGTLDSRGSLFEAYCRHIDHLSPKAFVFENVRGILGTNKGEDWKAIVSAFRKIGYSISYRILDACDYGIPQHRERMIMVGLKEDGKEFLFPRPIYGPDSESKTPHLSPENCFEGLSNPKGEEDSLVLRDGKYSHLLPLVPPGDNYLYFTEKRGYPTPVFAYRSRFSDFLYKANPSYPVKTIIASPGKYTGPLHWDNRYFTVSEYKAIQGFPQDYLFEGNRAEVIKQIGNSVSPKLSACLAKAVALQVFCQPLDIDLLATDESLSFDKRKGKKAQKTREYHAAVSQNKQGNEEKRFRLSDYRGVVTPHSFLREVQNVHVEVVSDDRVKLVVRSDSNKRLFAKMTLHIHSGSSSSSWEQCCSPEVVLDVAAYGENPQCIQTMWNAIDDLVIRSSNFHSLFELYGHFTEPHPIFSVVSFDARSSHPIANFAKHVADFGNCSRYFPKEHLVDIFGEAFGAVTFAELVEILRSYRFDIRSQEVNIAMPKDVYMVSYPFTLPYRKQMNFSVKKQSASSSAESYINYVRTA